MQLTHAAASVCRYCGVQNPACVVKCLSSGKWFCNGRMGSSGSCIIVHLVGQHTCAAAACLHTTPHAPTHTTHHPPRACLPAQVKSKSREVQLHKDSSLGEAVLECYASGNRNVFSLGFVPVAGDNTVVLLARDTPANSPAVRDLGVDMSQVRALSTHPTAV